MQSFLSLLLLLLISGCGKNKNAQNIENPNKKNLENTVKTNDLDPPKEEESTEIQEPTPESPKTEELISVLQGACREGEVETVNEQLRIAKQAHSENQPRTIGEKFKAIFSKKKGVLQEVRESKDKEGLTLLHITLLGLRDAINGKTNKEPNDFVEIFQALIDAGLSASMKDNNKLPPSHLIAELDIQKPHKALIKIAKILSRQNALDIKVNGQTALYVACRANKTSAINAFAKAGASWNIKDDSTGNTPLHIMVQKNHGGTLQNSLKYINTRLLVISNARKEIPLHLSISNGSFTISKQLLEAGKTKEQLYKRNKLGENSLQISIKSLQKGISKMLIEKANELSASNTKKPIDESLIMKSKNGFAPLHQCSAVGDMPTTQLLVEKLKETKHMNSVDRQGATPMLIAHQNGFKNIEKVLKENGGNLGAKTTREYN